MKLIVQEHINNISEPRKKVYSVNNEAVGTYKTVPMDIGLFKGDLIVFRGEGDPVRFSSGTAAGKYLMTDPTSETGWVLGDGGGGGGGSLVTLHNNTGEIILSGTVVKIDSGTNFEKATASDDDALFIVSEECGVNEDVACYSIRNTVCMILCTSDAVTVGDSLTISSTAGVCEKRTDTGDREVAVALSAKTSGSSGVVKALLSEVNPYAILAVKDGGTGATNAAGARTNLGALSKSGDTMTGDLQSGTPYGFVHKSPNYSQDETPSDNVFDTAVVLKDADDNTIGYIQHYVMAWNESMGIGISATREISGAPTYNGVSLLITPDGTKIVALDGDAWRTALTWVKAGDVTGTNTVTIPDTAVEVMAVVQPGTNSARFSNSIPKAELSDIWFVGGYYASSSDYAIVNLNVTNSKKTFQLRTVKYGNGTDLKASSKLTIYYK